MLLKFDNRVEHVVSASVENHLINDLKRRALFVTNDVPKKGFVQSDKLLAYLRT